VRAQGEDRDAPNIHQAQQEMLELVALLRLAELLVVENVQPLLDIVVDEGGGRVGRGRSRSRRQDRRNSQQGQRQDSAADQGKRSFDMHGNLFVVSRRSKA